MVAGLDIGNSTVVFRFFDQKELSPVLWRWGTAQFAPDFLKPYLEKASAVMISCVVDSMLPDLESLLREKNRECWILDQHFSSRVDFSTYQSRIGSDRVAGILGAAADYPVPFCVVDMGTATTVSVVDASFRYQGGLIMPGVGTMFRSINTSTYRLPNLNLEEIPEDLLGLTTEDNIRNGIYRLVCGGLEHILGNLKKEHPLLTVIGTGGWSVYFRNYFQEWDRDLLFRGLQFAYYERKKRE